MRLAELGINKKNVTSLVSDAFEFSMNQMFGSGNQKKQDNGFDADAFNETFESLPVIVRRMMTQASELQLKQQSYMYNNFIGKVIDQVPEHTKELDESVTNFVNSGFSVARGSGINIHYKTMIVGPEKSGKTTFLNIAAQKIYAGLLATGHYKETFLFIIDFDKLTGETITNAVNTYKYIVSQTIKQICIQKIEVKPYEDVLLNYFLELPTLSKLTQLPSKYIQVEDLRKSIPELTQISENIYNALKKHCSLQLFLTNVMLIPKFASRAFGFKRTIFIADHVDAADCDVPTNKLMDNDVMNLPFIEFVKLMLADSSFIISCRNEELALESLDLIAEDSTDLANGTEIFSILDSDVSEEHTDRFSFELSINDGTTMNLCKDDLGGASGYLHMWDTITEMGKELVIQMHKEVNSKKAKEQKLALFTKIRELVTILYTGDSETPFGKNVADFKVIETEEEE